MASLATVTRGVTKAVIKRSYGKGIVTSAIGSVTNN